MGNTCPGSSLSVAKEDVLMYQEADRVQQRTGKYTYVTDTPGQAESHKQQKRIGHGTGFHSTYDVSSAEGISMAVLIEHYQPYEFPICPVINSDTQSLVRNSWTKIMNTEFDSTELGGGKVSGASYFYVFSPDIKSRADIFSKVMSFCISIRIEELDLVKAKLRHLGQMHKMIIHHPHLFGIYASNMHSSIRHCLGDSAQHEVMSAWLHLLAFILRGMLPAYFHGLNFTGHYNGAVNAASTINEKARDEVRATDDMRVLRSKLASMAQTEVPSRLGNGTQELTGRERERSQTMVDTGVMTPIKESVFDKNVSPGGDLWKRGGGGSKSENSPLIISTRLAQEKEHHIPGTVPPTINEL